MSSDIAVNFWISLGFQVIYQLKNTIFVFIMLHFIGVGEWSPNGQRYVKISQF